MADRSFVASLVRRIPTRFVAFAAIMALLAGVVALYTAAFHYLMLREGRDYSWVTGFYWTLQTMSTLGFGDYTFTGDLGKLFSVAVLVTGVAILFIFLPFTLIQFLYAPWLEARAAARAPRELPDDERGHVLLTAHGPIESALIERLTPFRTPYAVIVPEVAPALALHDRGIRVMVGQLDDADTYRRARASQASLVATTLSDQMNATVALTVRGVSASVPIVATAAWGPSVDLLRHAGCSEVIQLGEMLGRAMALRIAGQNSQSHVVGQLDDLLIAEAAAANTRLVGQRLRETGLRDRLQITVAGVWERGRYTAGAPDVAITQDSVLLISGTRAQIDAYDREVSTARAPSGHAVIVGGGRVGRAVSRHLDAFGVGHTIVEQTPARVREYRSIVIGDATDPRVLEDAGLQRAESVAITTRSDDVNVFVTLYCHRVKPELQVLSRATSERNVDTLYRAGADLVLSYFPMEANAIFGVLRRGNLLLLAEGMDVFTVPVPRSLAGQSIAGARLRDVTGCNVLAVRPQGGKAAPPDPHSALAPGAELVILGGRDAARTWFARFGGGPA